MTFKGIVDSIMESKQEEVDRLAAAPEGSTSHRLSSLPVNVTGDLKGRIIRLPQEDSRVVVVPFHAVGSSGRRADGRMRRHGSWWEVVVVASDHLSYPVGGHHLSVSEAELVRGTVIDL